MSLGGLLPLMLCFLTIPGVAATTSWKVTTGTWNATANWTGGVPGNADTAVIDNGGTAIVTGGTARLLYAGYNSGGSGLIQLGTGGYLFIGTNAYLGYAANSSGTVAITGGTLNANTAFYVGYSGTGVVNLSSGLISTGSASVGGNAGSTGMVSVSGGTLAISGRSFTVGGSGTGTLTITNGGVVSVAGESQQSAGGQLLLGPSGTLNLGTTGTTAGTLSASQVVGGGSNATVNFNHTGLYTFGSQMTGTLSVNKLGSGTTVLTGTNDFQGLTKVSAGKLEVNGSLSTSGTVRVEMGATLGGSGTAGNVYAYGGTIQPTAGTTLSLASLTLTSTSTLVSTITSATTLGQVKVSGAVSLSGTLALSGLSYLTQNTAVTLIDETGTSLLNGSFGSVTVSGSRVSLTALDSDSFIFTANSLLYKLDYNSGSDGRDLRLTLIPEPPQTALLMSGVGLLCCVRRLLRPRYL